MGARPSRPICSMIHGFTGITNFEELALIFTGYEITPFGAQSSGISMGIPFIAVGFLSKITAVPFRAAYGRPMGTDRLRPIPILSGRPTRRAWNSSLPLGAWDHSMLQKRGWGRPAEAESTARTL